MAKVRKTATKRPPKRTAGKRAAKAATKPRAAKPRSKAKRAPPARHRTSKPRAAATPAAATELITPATRARAATSPGGAVVRILDEASPRDALRELLEGIDKIATVQEAQIALGAAQLMLSSLPRGSDEALDVVDLVVSQWHLFPDRIGMHAQEFLRNAFAAVGDDRELIAHLATLVPLDASPELRLNMACAYAAAGERLAMLREVEAALAVGIEPAQFTRERDFAAYADDAQLRALLERAAAPASDPELN